MLIYLAQLTHEKNNQSQNKCFPLGSGYIAAYLKSIFKEQISVELFKSPSEFNQAVTGRVPDVVMFGLYMWNESLTCEFASAIKEKHPETLVIIGGPNISLDRSKRIQFLKQHKYVDLLVLFEGEFTAEEIIRSYLKKRSIPALKRQRLPYTIGLERDDVFEGDLTVENRVGLTNNKIDIASLPSPYLNNMFDKFFQDGEVPLIESSRGCPFTCCFCQQGGIYFSRVRHFPATRFEKEMFYIARKIRESGKDMHSIEIADPNFAMYPRDEEICKILRKVQDEYDFPKNIGSSTGKNRADIIIQNINHLVDGSILLRSAMQSLNEDTLQAIKRKNIQLNTYIQLQAEMEKKGLENNADIMLGLPLETLESHIQGIAKLIDIGVKEFSNLQTIILRGTEFENPDYQEKYSIRTKYRVIPECFGTYNLLGKDKKIMETEAIIIETSTMSFEDYLQSRKFHYIVMIYHNTRLLSAVYDFLETLGIAKSEVVKELLRIHDEKFDALVGAFLEDTRNELFEDNQSSLALENAEVLTFNKIFRHLSIALFQKKDVVVDALSKALLNILGTKYGPEIDELMKIVDSSIISPFADSHNDIINLKSELLASVFGPAVKVIITNRQLSLLQSFNKIYKTPEDKVNKMLYHLRPGNIVKKLEYTGKLSQKPEP